MRQFSALKKLQAGGGFTLAELLVTLTMFGILSLSILSTCVVANGYWLQGNQQTSSQGNARAIFQTILNELKQALPDPDPGGLNPATGYLSITPAVPPTGVLFPNVNASTGATLTFTEASTTNYTPFSAGWNPATASNYKKITYSVQGGNTLQRLETSYAANGSVASTRTDQVLQSKRGTLQLQSTYFASSFFNVSVTGNESGKIYSLTSDVYLEEK